MVKILLLPSLICLSQLIFFAAAGYGQSRFSSLTYENGLPQNSVWTILQTGDGYLWAGTFEGLARFDGVNFKVFDNTNTAELKSNWIRSLAEDRNGNLWIAVEGGGLVQYRKGQFTHFSESEGLPSAVVRILLTHSSGDVWIGTDRVLSRMRDGRITNFTTKDGLPGDSIASLAEDDAGALWIGTSSGLARFEDNRFTVYDQTDGLTNNVINSLAWDRRNGLWIGTGQGLNLWQNDRPVDFKAKTALSAFAIRSLYSEPDKALWIGTDKQGLMQIATTDADLELKAVKDLSGETVLSIYATDSGALWVGGYKSGLNRLTEGRFRTFSRPEGINEDEIRAVFGDRADNLWFGTEKSIYRLRDEKLTNYRLPDGSINPIFTIAEDSEAGMWFGGVAAGIVWRLKEDKFTALTVADGVPNYRIATLLGDRAGALWIGTVNGGLGAWRDGKMTVYTTADGLVDNHVNALHEARNGSIWIGTRNGVSRYENGRFTSWTMADGLSNDRILSFYEAPDGGIWIGTNDGGLSRYKDGAFAVVSSRNGLYDNLAFQILEADGDLWMSGNRGIYRASLEELNAVADGTLSVLTSYSYGTDDGMLTRECNGASPAGWKTGGRFLWFATAKGLVRVDSQDKNLSASPILIETIRIDNQNLPNLPIDEPLRLTPEQENLEINYTAINWTRPKQIRFKYRIENLDREWTDAANRRTAYYSHLPPGEYTFRVIADNGDGVWNLTGSSLRIIVLPPFYRTWWFFSLGILGFLAIIYLSYNYRIRRLERKNTQQMMFSNQLIQSQERERTRIAANLHDSLGQQLLVIKNWAMMEIASNVERRESSAEALNEISGAASEAIEEVREIIYDLRPYQLDKIGLTKTLSFMIEKVAAASGIGFAIAIDEIDDLYDYDSEITLYRIVQECLNNILKHSGARRARVIIKKAESRLHLTIEDDGCGFAPESIDSEYRKGGFGLTGVGERVRMLGGAKTIVSSPDGGTKIEVSIPFEKLNDTN